MTTEEANEAEELRRETLAEDTPCIEHEHDEASEGSDRNVPPAPGG